MSRGERLASGVSRSLAAVSGIALAVMLAMSATDALLRLVGAPGFAGVIERSQVLLVTFAMTSLAYTEMRRGHVDVPLVIQLLPRHVGRGLRLLAMIIALALISWMVYATAGRAVEAVAVREIAPGIARVPFWPARVVVPVGLFALLIQIIVTMRLIVRDADDPANMPKL